MRTVVAGPPDGRRGLRCVVEEAGVVLDDDHLFCPRVIKDREELVGGERPADVKCPVIPVEAGEDGGIVAADIEYMVGMEAEAPGDGSGEDAPGCKHNGKSRLRGLLFGTEDIPDSGVVHGFS